MAGRGSFQAISPDNVTRLLNLKGGDLWDFAAGEDAARFVARMDKMWAPIHCALSDGSLCPHRFGTILSRSKSWITDGENCNTDHR